MSGLDVTALRRCVLAVSVLGDVDAVPSDDGIVAGAARVPWSDVADTVGPDDPMSTAARRRVERLLRLHALVADARDWRSAGDLLSRAARLVALPKGHADHLGPGWAEDRLLGGALDVGIAVIGLAGGDPDEVAPLPPSVARAVALPRGVLWEHVLGHAEAMGRLAVTRLRRDGLIGSGVVRPVGGCDVLALLASPSLRGWLAAGDGTGMRAVAAPMRNRGWFDLIHIDPAFVGPAWMATQENLRGVSCPLLVTRDEVGLARRGAAAADLTFRAR